MRHRGIFSRIGMGALAALAGPQALSASEGAESEAFAQVGSGDFETEEAADPHYSPISIDAPVGTVRLAQAGEALGERRYEARSGTPGAMIVTFSRTRPRRAVVAAGGIKGGTPAGLPLGNARLTSGFGYRLHPLSGRYQPHAGVDLAAPAGTPVVATADGMVGLAGWMGGYGLTVRIDHGAEIETRYAHLSALAVAPGEPVKAGQVVGYVGSTGRSTGPHLHYEVRVAAVAVDPLR